MVAHTKYVTEEERHEASLRSKRKHYHANVDEQRKKARARMSRLRANKREADRLMLPSTCATLATYPQSKPDLTTSVGPSRDQIQSATAEELHAMIEELWERPPFKMLFSASGDDPVGDWVTALLVTIENGGLMEFFKLFMTQRSAINIAWDLFEPLREEISQRDPEGASPLNASSARAHGELLQEEALVDDIERILQNCIKNGLVVWRDRRRSDHMRGRGRDMISN
ncbi:hypothetical protein K439DRAFT_1161715 [Ramaria rubella]|nr:hypothetical protein K439DRAFT_1161715 [Ramaria rubella]